MSESVAQYLDVLVETHRGLLESSDARTRVRGMHSLALAVSKLERGVLNETNAEGVTWAEIGEVYGVSRQAVHRRFAETVASAEFFDEFVASLEEPAEIVPALARAAQRVSDQVETG